MPPLPKKKTSKARLRKRRMHLSAEVETLVPCPRCRSPRLPHHACPVCGTYEGRQILAIDNSPR